MRYNISRLIKARLLKGWTRGDLALRVGLSENMIWKVENGTRASEKTIFKMAQVLGVPMKHVLIEETIPETSIGVRRK